MIENRKIPLLAVRLASSLFQFGDGIEVKILGDSYFKNKDVTAFTTRDYTVVFNEAMIDKVPFMELFVTAFHETRHAYQFACIDFKDKNLPGLQESEERLALWKNNIDNYYMSDSLYDPDYLNQDIEIDAIAFAHYLIDKLFNLKTVIPEIIKEQVTERVKEFEDKYNSIALELRKIEKVEINK